MITRSDAPRPRGRPAGGRSGLRSRLLQAARWQLEHGDAAGLTLQQVARTAGASPSLAHYYFGSRDGLVAALLAERGAPRIEDLLSAARVRAAQPVAALTFLMQRLTALLASDAVLNRTLLLEVPVARQLRDRLRAVLRELLEAARQQGQLRADLPLDYLVDALLGLTLMPFLDPPTDEVAPGERAAALTLAHVALLQDGIVRAQRPRQDSGS